jgi:hypothetical protein
MDDLLASSALSRALALAELTLSVKRGAAGHAQPQVVVECPHDFPEPRARAVVFTVAALASMATPLDERWVVRSDPGARRAYLDLSTGAHGREIERALRVLRIVISSTMGCPRN